MKCWMGLAVFTILANFIDFPVHNVLEYLSFREEFCNGLLAAIFDEWLMLFDCLLIKNIGDMFDFFPIRLESLYEYLF